MNAMHFDWDGLLDSIEGRLVIPILGGELLRLELEGRNVQLDRYLAERLAENFEIPLDTLPAGFNLNDVACACIERGVREDRLYLRLYAILKERPLPLPETLLKLAEISGFTLFVNTTPDDLLVQTLNSVRHGGDSLCDTRVFSPRLRNQDLPCDPRELSAPLVYQLFGHVSPARDYVLMDRDVLEFMRVLRSGHERPKRLFDALRDHDLLILGCSFPDWLTRFFLDTVADILNPPRALMKTIADECTPKDSSLMLFLGHCRVDVVTEGGAVGFVNELHRRWKQRHPAGEGPSRSTHATASDLDDMPPEAIFLSYAHEDLESVLNMKRALEAAGLDVWLDRRKLDAGDLYEGRIRQNVQRCSLFLPFISRHACARIEGFFRKEWTWAIDRADRFDESYPFLLPIAIDDTAYDAPRVPEALRKRHWQFFPEGRPNAEFVEFIKAKVRELRRREAGRV